MAVRATLKYLRISPRKARLVADMVRGLDVDDAEVHLAHLPKRAAEPLLKLLKSAIANAQHNFSLNRGNLFISELRVDGGPILKRYRPRAFGRSAQIKKRTSHIMLVLEERKTPLMKKRRFVIREEKKTAGAAPTLEELEKGEAKEREPKTFRPELEKKRGFTKRISDAGRKFFRRKSV